MVATSAGRGTVEDKGGGEVFAMRGEGEGLASTPAEADHGDLAVGGGQLLAVVGCGVQIGGDHVRIEAGDGFDGCVLAREFAGPPPLGPKPESRSGATTM